MSYLETDLTGLKRTEFEKLVDKFKKMSDEEWNAKILAEQRKAEEERINKEKKAKDEYEKLRQYNEEKAREVLRQHNEWLKYRESLHGCGCIVKDGDEKSGYCLDCCNQD